MINLIITNLTKKIAGIISAIFFLIIFLSLITPISLFLKIFKIDRLKIKKKDKETYWLDRKKNQISPKSFKNQY